MKTIRQHEPLRVPAGWTGQDKSLVIQLERLLDDIYRLLGIHDGAMVTAVSYDTTNKKLTVTINGKPLDIVTVSTIKTDLNLTKSDVGLGNVDNKSSETIRSEITAQNIEDALGYTPQQYDTKNTTGTKNKKNKKLYIVGAETQAANPQTNSNEDVYIGADNCLYSGGAKVLTAHQDISGKADKDTDAVSGNFAAFDASGNPVDSGHKHSDYLTQHQDISGKADKSATVSTVAYDSTNKKITKTINGSTTDVVAVSAIKSALGSFTWGALAGQ